MLHRAASLTMRAVDVRPAADKGGRVIVCVPTNLREVTTGVPSDGINTPACTALPTRMVWGWATAGARRGTDRPA